MELDVAYLAYSAQFHFLKSLHSNSWWYVCNSLYGMVLHAMVIYVMVLCGIPMFTASLTKLLMVDILGHLEWALCQVPWVIRKYPSRSEKELDRVESIGCFYEFFISFPNERGQATTERMRTFRWASPLTELILSRVLANHLKQGGFGQVHK